MNCVLTYALVVALAVAAALLGSPAAAETSRAERFAAFDTPLVPRGLNAPASDPIEGGIVQAPVVPSVGGSRLALPDAREREPRGNPLWAIPLRSLTATRERPLFVPSRRPPPPAVAALPSVQVPSAPPSAAPDRPALALVGAIVGERDGIAIFLDQATNDMVRLRTGENHAGWVLRSVRGREATLVKDTETVILALPAPGGDPQQQQPQGTNAQGRSGPEL